MTTQGLRLLLSDIRDFHELMQDNAGRALGQLSTYQLAIDEAMARFGGQLSPQHPTEGCLLEFKEYHGVIEAVTFLRQRLFVDEHIDVHFMLLGAGADVLNPAKVSEPGVILVEAASREEWEALPASSLSAFRVKVEPHSDTFARLSIQRATPLTAQLPDPAPPPERPADAHSKRWLMISGMAAIVLLCAAFFSSQLNSSATSENPGKKETLEPSIAVLPFANLSADSTTYFADGMMEDILTHLAKFQDLKVISRTSVMQYRDTRKTIPQIGQELGVSYILEGSVRTQGEQVRVTVQLIQAEEDQHLWAENYERKLADIFAIQTEVSRKIAITLNQTISPELAENISREPTSNMAAYNALLESRELNRIRTESSMKESLRRLDYALSLDPNFSDALADKAATLSVMSSLGYADAPKQYDEQAEHLALKAIQLDPQSHIAYATLGNVYFDAKKWRQSETAFKIALQHNPNDALTNYWYSLQLRELGRMEEAIHYGSIAAELDPLYPVIQTGHALSCMMGGRMEMAQEIIERVEPFLGNYFGFFWIRGYYKMASQQYEAAIQDFDHAQELSPSITSIQRQIIYCKGKLGQVREVSEYINQQEGETLVTYINLASAYAGLGEKQTAIAQIRKAWEVGGFSTGAMYNEKFKGLLDEPEYQSLLREMKQREELLVQ